MIQTYTTDLDVKKILKDVDLKDNRYLTILRSDIESKRLAPNMVLRNVYRLYANECICLDHVYLITGICIQFGAEFDKVEKCICILPEKVAKEVKTMFCVSLTYCIQDQYNKEIRNWLSSLMNRDDLFEGGICPIPSVYLENLREHLFRAVNSGSFHYYKGVVHFMSRVSCDGLKEVLEIIVDFGIAAMDLTPIKFAVEQGEYVKKYALKKVENREPRDQKEHNELKSLFFAIQSMKCSCDCPEGLCLIK